MGLFIKMTNSEAASVRGPSATRPMFALDPIERVGGIFILPVEVLTMAVHEEHTAFLEALPTIDSDDPSFPADLPPPEHA